MDKHRLIDEFWIFGCCENCRGNPKNVGMVQEHLVSGDPKGRQVSKKEFWVCPNCGYTKEL